MTKKIKLVISGSGTKLPVFAGAIKRLELEGCQIQEVIGTSGGSIIAAAVASGLSADQIMDLCRIIMPKINKMMDYSVINFLTWGGFVKGDKIHKEFEQHFIKTLGEAKIPLHIVTTNFDTDEEEIFSTQKTPKIETAIACGASMAIPAVFEPVAINGDLHMDGGIYANFAIDYFGNTPDVIGLYFSKTKGRLPRPKGWFKSVEMLARVIDMFISAKTEDDIGDAPLTNKIGLTTSIGSLTFNLSDEQINTMIQEGYEQTDRWLKENTI
jgi:NTE family protein